MKEACIPLDNLRQTWPGCGFSINQSFSCLSSPFPWHPNWRLCILLSSGTWYGDTMGTGVASVQVVLSNCCVLFAPGFLSMLGRCSVHAMSWLLGSCQSHWLHPTSLPKGSIGAVLAACAAAVLWVALHLVEPLQFA